MQTSSKKFHFVKIISFWSRLNTKNLNTKPINMRLSTLISFFIVSMILSSCSTYKMADGHLKRKLKRADLEYKTLKTDDYTITYWDNGDTEKPPYVLFHGFGSSTRFQWHEQAKKLSKTHRLILPNLLHFGSTPNEQDCYSISDHVKAMSVLLDSLDIDKMVLGGISYGGVVAAELAQMQPEKVEKLTIFSSPVKFFRLSDLSSIEEKFQVDDVEELLVPKDIDMMREMFDLITYKSPSVPKFVLKDLHENLFCDKAVCDSKKAVLSALKMDAELLMTSEYDFSFPILLVWGENDELIPPRIGNELLEYLPTAELYMIPKSGHAPNFEQEKKFNKVLFEFLEK